jgi:hypothetical protein
MIRVRRWIPDMAPGLGIRMVGLPGLEPGTSSLPGKLGQVCHLLDRRSGVDSRVRD